MFQDFVLIWKILCFFLIFLWCRVDLIPFMRGKLSLTPVLKELNVGFLWKLGPVNMEMLANTVIQKKGCYYHQQISFNPVVLPARPVVLLSPFVLLPTRSFCLFHQHQLSFWWHRWLCICCAQGQPACGSFKAYGFSKYGASCKFDHQCQ